MIVRISNEGQFRLDDGLHARLNDLDDAAVRRRRGAATRTASTRPSRSCCRSCAPRAHELEDEDLDASDVILPPSDLSFVEAGEEFTGDGLIPEPA